MQRDVKIGIAIGVLLILLIGIFWWSRHDAAPRVPADEEDTSLAQLPPSEDPTAPEGQGHGSPYLAESPEVAVAPPAPDAVVNPQATLEGPSAPPVATPQPAAATAPASPAAKVFHTIKSGDTLSGISQKYYGTTTKWKRIQEANRDKIPDPARLRVGLKIVIPDVKAPGESPDLVPVAIPPAGGAASSARTHTVATGESLSTIAKNYYGDEGKWRTIYDANRDVVKDPDRLKQGMKLVIP